MHNINNKKILILGAGEMQVPLIKMVKELGFFSIVVDYDNSAPGFIYANEKYFVSTNDFEKIMIIMKNNQVDSIVTTSDFPVNIVAKISNYFGLTSMSEDVAEICTNKFIQRSIFQRNDINTPFFRLISSIDDAVDLSNFPYIIKPIDSSASRGVKKINNKSDFHKYFIETLSYSKNGKIIVEEYIEGREFSVETLTQNNITSIIAITEKLVLGEDKGYFVEDTHIIPANITEIEKKLIENEVSRAISVIGLNNAPTHTEVKLNSKGVFIIEIACRLGGDFITSDLVPLATGVNMIENLILLSLNTKISIESKYNKFAAVQFINSENYERCSIFVQSKNKSIIRFEIKEYHNRIIKNSLDRMGYIIIQSNTKEELESILKKIK